MKGKMGFFTQFFCFALLPFLVSNKDIITVLKELKNEMKLVNKRMTQVEHKLDVVDVEKVNKTMSDLRTALNKDIQTMSRNLTSLRIQQREDVKIMKSEIFRFYQLDKFIRFPWPNFGKEGSNHYIWGYVEIYHEGKWGSICDRGFDDRDANVACKTAGFKAGVYDNKKYDQNERYEGKSPMIWLADLQCKGTEDNISMCPNVRWGHITGWGCGRDHDVGIKCYI